MINIKVLIKKSLEEILLLKFFLLIQILGIYLLERVADFK